MKRNLDSQSLRTRVERIRKTPLKFLVRWGIERKTALKIHGYCDTILKNEAGSDLGQWIWDLVSSYRNEYRTAKRTTRRYREFGGGSVSAGDVPTCDVKPDSTISELRNLLDDATGRFCTPKQAARLRKSIELDEVASSALSEVCHASRVQVRESIVTARAKTLAGAIILACESKNSSIISLLLSEDFALLGPFCDKVMKQFDHLVSQECGDAPNAALMTGLQLLWHKAEQRVLTVARNLHAVEPAELCTLQPAFMSLFLTARVNGPAMCDSFRDLWKAANKTGVLANQHVCRHLATIGSYCGCDGHQIDFLRRNIDLSNDIEIAGTSIFVAGDIRSRLPLRQLIFGNPQAVMSAINSAGGMAYRQLLDYTVTCLNSSRYASEGLVEMILRWTRRVCLEAQSNNIKLPRNRVSALKHSLLQYRNRLCISFDTTKQYDFVTDKLSCIA